MPEYPDLEVYRDAIEHQVVGQKLLSLRLFQPFVLRTALVPLENVVGKKLQQTHRIGKRLVLSFEEDFHLVIHLMVLGRLRYLSPDKKIPGKGSLLALDFEGGTLLLVESGTKRRATLHVVQGPKAWLQFDRGGVEVFQCTEEAFSKSLKNKRHTLKRALTDPRIVAGVGNAYSDEILHRAQLSPFKMTDTLSPEEMARLFSACKDILKMWTDKFRAEAQLQFPAKVTAFRPEMEVHGRYREKCRFCDAPIQRIVHGKRETNYCPGCQTGGKIYADRALSRLLKKDWPRTLEELEAHPLGQAAQKGS